MKTAAKELDINHRVGDRIRAQRESIGYTTTHLASLLNIHRQSINRIERGSNSVGIDLLARVAETLGVTVGSLVD